MSRAVVPLRGRDRELAVVERHVRDLKQGRGGVVLVQGPPGSGRSRLLSEVRATAGVRCHAASGAPGEDLTPFGALLDALLTGRDPLLDRAALREFPRFGRRFWWLQELRNALERAAAASPLTVLIDDVQWCDGETLAALHALPTRLSGHPILWGLASQAGPGPVQDLAHRLTEDGASVLDLGPLPAETVATIATDVLEAEPDPDVLKRLDGAAGSPALVIDLLRGMREEGTIVVRDGVARLAGKAHIPARLRSSVRRRLDRLSAPTRQTMRVASLLGARFSACELADLMGVRPSELVAPVREAVTADLLTDDGGLLAFRHGLIREAASSTVPAALRRTLRRQAVDAGRKLRPGDRDKAASPHTVGTHLRHLLSTLGVRSRVELVRIVFGHEGR